MDNILPPWIKNKRRDGDFSDEVRFLFFHLMKELHLSYEDIRKMPLPAILAMSETIVEYNKEQEKAMKKARKSR